MDIILSEWRLVGVAVTVLLLGILLLVVRFIQPRALYGTRHLLLVAEARRLFLRRLAGKPVASSAFVRLVAQDFRHESVDSDLQVVLTRVSRIRELFRVLDVGRTDLPKGTELPAVGACVTELAQIIGSMASRLVSVGEYDYDLVPADVVLGTIAERIGREHDGNFRLDNESDVEQWFRQYPISIEQVVEILIAVVFALSLRERSSVPPSRGTRGKFISLKQRPGKGVEGIKRLIEAGESMKVEFKSTLKRNLYTGAADPVIEFEIIKTIAAFLNTEGGTLLVGVSDDGILCGYDYDLFKSEDQVKRFIGSKVQTLLGGTMDQLIETSIETIDSKDIVRIECRKSPDPAFTKGKGGDEAFFIRSDAATRQLGLSDLKAYLDQRFGGPQLS